MKTKYGIFIGFSLVLTVALFKTFGSTDSIERSPFAGSSPRIHANEVRLPTALKDEDVYYAILLMPKSYLPLLESFKSRKIAKDIRIIPADIEWSDGRMVAISKRIGKNDGYRQLESAGSKSGEDEFRDEFPAFQEDKMFRSPLPLLFLQGLAESKSPYNPAN